jgi:surface antigen
MRQRTRAVIGSIAAALTIVLAPGGAFADTYWQCVPFARLISGVQIFGDAWTWWRQAAGRYETGQAPQAGAVLCFRQTGRMRLGHVAVVSQVLTDRIIQVTHANWSLINGSRGQVERDVTVVDVSAQGDWSQVRVWYGPIGGLGGTTYPTYGFIYSQRARQPNQFEQAQNAAVTMAQSAANQVVSAILPGRSAVSMVSQAAESGDRIAGLLQQATQPASSLQQTQPSQGQSERR